MAKPFVKWAGGKTQFLLILKKYSKLSYGRLFCRVFIG